MVAKHNHKANHKQILNMLLINKEMSWVSVLWNRCNISATLDFMPSSFSVTCQAEIFIL